jgi:hypothetical protein
MLSQVLVSRVTGHLATSVLSRKYVSCLGRGKWNTCKRLTETNRPNCFRDSTLVLRVRGFRIRGPRFERKNPKCNNVQARKESE